MIRKVVMNGPILAVLPVVHAATVVKDESNSPAKPPPMRPSDLPIYETPHADYAEYVTSEKNQSRSSYLRSLLAQPVSTVRKEVQAVLSQTDAITSTIKDNCSELQDRSSWIVKYLQEEDNKEQRYGAVAIGGLTGFIFGLRGGIFRRLFYATIGTGVMGSICFPEETEAITKNAGSQARHYINVAYNFCYGVKPGDPQLEVKFPELSFPKDFSEFVNMTVSLASSVKQAVMPPPLKEGADAPAKSN